ncbi:MAG: ABC transporter ATP-binding protein [Gaiellaceae bacterium]
MSAVRFVDVTKRYPDGTLAVDGLDLTIDDGDFVVLVGPSGCGKTTALRMVAGLEEISDGEIFIGDRVVNGLEPRRRDVAMVFQNYALYPNMTVADNIAFGLKMRKVSRTERDRKVASIAEILGLTDYLAKKPGALSGGQRQRVAMGRAIVRDPEVFLLDEPLSNLDAKLRVQMRAEIARIQREVGTTTVYVTHDQIEAMTMGTAVAVMRKGLLQQFGSPREIYDSPRNLFVASFIGSPPMNLFEVTVTVDGDTLACTVGSQTLALPLLTPDLHARLKGYSGRRVALGVRPESLGEVTAPGSQLLRVRVTQTEQLGSEVLVHAELDAEPVTTTEVREVAADVDLAALTDLTRGETSRKTTILARFGPRANLQPGDEVALAVDVTALHFFDLDSEQALGETIPSGAARPSAQASTPSVVEPFDVLRPE